MLARTVVVPFAVAPDQVQQLLDRAVAVAFGVERQRKIEAGLVIVGIGRELLVQRRRVARLRRLFAQLEFGFDRADRFVGRAVGAHETQRRTRAFEIAALQIAAREARDRTGMAGFVLQHMAVGLRRIAEIAGSESLVGRSQNLVGMARARFAARQLLHEGSQLRFRNCAREAVDRLAVLERVNGRDRLDAQLAGNFLVLVDVHLDETHGALGFRNDLFERGSELLARPAPRRPEIDNHGNVPRRFQHIGREGFQRNVFDKRARRAGGRCVRHGGRRAGHGPACGTDQGHSKSFQCSRPERWALRPRKKRPRNCGSGPGGFCRAKPGKRQAAPRVAFSRPATPRPGSKNRRNRGNSPAASTYGPAGCPHPSRQVSGAPHASAGSAHPS